MSVIPQESPPSIFGPIVTGYDVEGWVVDQLKAWSSTYLAEVERQHGIEACSLQRVRGWSLAPTFDKWPEDQLPGVLVVCRGLVPPPLKSGDGKYRAKWAVDVGVICSARTQADSHSLAMLFLAAHAEIVIGKPSLGGHATGVAWLDEQYDQLVYDDTRSLYTGTATFAIEVPDVRTAATGPTQPDPPEDPCADWPPWPEVETVEIEIDKEPLPEGGSL